MKVKINSLVSLEIEQIKISGTISIAGKSLPAGFNKTLDAAIVEQLPRELLGRLAESAFGADDSRGEIEAIVGALNAEIASQNSGE